MADITTYRKMNARIVDILRVIGSPQGLYAAQRIEELEAENQRLRKLLTLFLEASAACDTSICGLALDHIKDALKEDRP